MSRAAPCNTYHHHDDDPSRTGDDEQPKLGKQPPARAPDTATGDRSSRTTAYTDGSALLGGVYTVSIVLTGAGSW